jgi:hypothetical protein
VTVIGVCVELFAADVVGVAWVPHLKAKECPGYERDQSIPRWQGSHAARLGQQPVSSRHPRTGDSEDSASLERQHHDELLHQKHGVRGDGSHAEFAENLEGQNLRDSDSTPKQNSGSAEIVN